MNDIQIGGVTVTDAFIDWNLGYSNSPELILVTDQEMNENNWLPLPSRPSNHESVVMEYDGVWRGFKAGSSFENRRTYTVAVEGNRDVEGTWSYHHSIKRHIDSPTIAATVVTGINERRSPTTFNVNLGRAQQAVERFINEDVEGTGASYWYALRSAEGPYTWHQASHSRDRWDGYVDCTVRLVEGDVYEYMPERVSQKA
jgi:hypothetical protein